VSVLRRYWPIAAATALLVVAGFAAATGSLPLRPAPLGPVNERQPTWDPHLPTDQPTQALPTGQAAVQHIELPPIFVLVVQVLCAALAVGVIILLVVLIARGAARRTRDNSDPVVRPAARETAREVLAALDQGLAELDEGDPRQAVIACWVRLERAAEDSGVQRRPGDTSTDLVVRLLTGRSVNGSVLNDFAAVYREARYSPHPIDATTRDQARAALRLLRDELGAMTPGAGS
jgi:hypothetical protein